MEGLSHTDTHNPAINISASTTIRNRAYYSGQSQQTYTAQWTNQLEANKCNRHQAWENACEQVTVDLGFCFSLVEKVARVYYSYERVVKQTKSEHEFNFDKLSTHLRTTLSPQSNL